MLSDLRLSFRALRKARGFTFVAVLTLAVGIGATTAIFSALQALVVSPLHYPREDRLVDVWSGDKGWSLSPADGLDLREQTTCFSAFGMYRPDTFNVGEDKAQMVAGAMGTSDMLRAFGVQPQLGRLFTPADDAEGAPPVTILSHALWQNVFGGDPHVIGRKIRLSGRDMEVVGVMPADFEFACPWMRTEDCQLWVIHVFDQEERKRRDSHYLIGIARLRDGATVASADAEVKTIGKRLTALYPNTNTRKAFAVLSLRYDMTKDLGRQVWLLFGAVALVLLVACGNVASMLLARSTRRQAEFGVRVALGASRWQLVKLALLETTLLALAGAVVGAGLAYGGIEVLRVVAPVTAARKAAITLNALPLAFGLGVTVLTVLLAGLPPALSAMRTSITTMIRSDARGAVGSRSQHAMLRGLIIAQVALAFVLANGAVLFARGYLEIMRENQLLATETVFTAEVALNGPRYEQDAVRVRFWYDLVDRVRGLPGVQSVAVTSKLPLEGGSNTGGLVNDEVYDPTQVRLQIERSSVTEDYFAAMGLPILQGRGLKTEDRTGDIRGTVVNEEMVRRAWPNKNPLGEIIRANMPGKPWYTVRVVGVVENVKQFNAEADVQPEMYLTPEGHWGRRFFLVVRSRLPASQLAAMIRPELTSMDRELALKDPQTMRDLVGHSTQGARVVTGLVNFFMAVALGLMAVGLYGTLSYHVQQRTREIGVRVAIGAQKANILALVFAQGGRWVAIGLGLGLAGSVALTSALKSLVYHLSGLSVPPLLLAGVGVGLATMVACWLPARRAAQLDPLEALRTE